MSRATRDRQDRPKTPRASRPRRKRRAARRARPIEIDDGVVIIPPRVSREEAIRVLQSWRDNGDPKEQAETFEVLRRALGKDRQSPRKLFP